MKTKEIERGRYQGNKVIECEIAPANMDEYLRLKEEEKPLVYYKKCIWFHIKDNLFAINDYELAEREDSYITIDEPTICIVINCIIIHRGLSEILNYSQLYCNQKSKSDNRYKKTYIMYDEISGYYKIGKSLDVANREHTLAAQTPKIKAILTCEENIEAKLHTEYAKKRMRGEWFKLSADNILDIIKKYHFKKYQ